MENEDWRYDKWPEFYLGKNVADFYDKDIEEKLNKLEEEEAEILEMEAEQEAARE
jgi:nucleolar GTP-binding protein